jgi:phage baseplate assembly protein gpV
MANQGTQAGVRTARVVNNIDPTGDGRIEIVVATKSGKQRASVWARRATLSAGDRRGAWFPPEVGDEVLVAFEQGDTARPIVIGALWSAGATPPESGPEQAKRTTIRTRSGALIRIEDPGTSARPTITVETGAGDSVRIGPAGIDVRSSVTVVVSAAAKVELAASAIEANAATFVADAALARFAGVVQCETLVANSVVASNYTPGVGNIW